jgi:6,7-dimethyl-8-ribityllumazine synthase
MAKKEHKPAQSGKQVYAERKAAGICVSCAKFKAAKDSVECPVCKAMAQAYAACKKAKRAWDRANFFRSKAGKAALKAAVEVGQ